MFGETIEAVEKRVEAGIGKVTVAKTLDLAAPTIAKLLRKDDIKREKAAGGMVFSWEKPQYDTAAQQRRLRILSAIFLATARFGGRADTWGGGHDKPIEEFAVVVGHQRVLVKATVVESSPQRKPDNEPRTATARIRIEMDRSTFWEDGESPIERQVREIAVAIVAQVEKNHRAAAVRQREWQIERKVELLEEARRAREEAERTERERLAELERQRVACLLAEADAFRKAREIRQYVNEANAANRTSANPVSEDEMARWSAWAHEQADRIDPVRQGLFDVHITEWKTSINWAISCPGG
nr:hypothetical protein [uncultured Rhodopila sp.]